jgi:hypothetical protein
LFVGVLIAIMVMPMVASANDPQHWTSNGHTYGGDEKEPWRGSILRVNFVYNSSYTESDWTPEWMWVYNELWHGGQSGYCIGSSDEYDDSGKHKVDASVRIYHSESDYFQTYGYHEVPDPDSVGVWAWDRWSIKTYVRHP